VLEEVMKHTGQRRGRRAWWPTGLGFCSDLLITAMVKATDVFIIGGGPAGLATAIAARQRGFDVVVADGAKPSIDKPCGEGLMPDGRAALEKLGIGIPEIAYPFRGIRFVSGGLRVDASFPNGAGQGVRRTVLHNIMVALQSLACIPRACCLASRLCTPAGWWVRMEVTR